MRVAAALVALVVAAPVPAQVVTSPAPEGVSVTVYRNPYRGRGALDLHWLGGFALITETRTVRLPAGRATVRFEGVADGIVPVSAIVAGLPGGVVEKNRDARLLSPAALIDGSLGRRVTLRRTDRKSGRVREEEAELVSGTEGGVVIRTREGIETLGCSGLGESVRYPRVPDGLSAKPVLSVETVTRAPVTARVTLSYLASGFDWAANYVATVAADGRTLDLTAWMTLANGNAQGFPAAAVQVVAGRLNHAGGGSSRRYVPPLQLRCYPLGTTTSTLRPTLNVGEEEVVMIAQRLARADAVPAPPPPPPPLAPPPPEDLGDLKLYRVPERVTVAANAQKQVVLLARARVPFERVYTFPVSPGVPSGPASPMQIVLRMSNKVSAGLGLPLPAGGVVLYAPHDGRLLLNGEGALGDKAIGETVRVAVGESSQVLFGQTVPEPGVSVLSITNASTTPAMVELPIGDVGEILPVDDAHLLPRVDGVPTWTVTVLPGERRTLTYHFRERTGT